MRFPYRGFEVEATNTQTDQWRWMLIERGHEETIQGDGYESRGSALDAALTAADQQADARTANIQRHPPVQAGGDTSSDEIGVLRMIASQLAVVDPWETHPDGSLTCHYCKQPENHTRFCSWQLAQHYRGLPTRIV